MKPPTDEMCQSARSKFDRAGIRCVSYYYGHHQRRSGSGLCGSVCEAVWAPRNVSGDATGTCSRKIDERLSHEGLTFGIHNHYFKQKFAYESPDDVLKALAGRSKTMGSTLDVGHIASLRLRYRGSGPETGAVSEDGAFEGRGGRRRRRQCSAWARASPRSRPSWRNCTKCLIAGWCAIEYEKEGNVDAT